MKTETKGIVVHVLVLVGLAAHITGGIMDIEALGISGLVVFVIGIVIMHFGAKSKK